MGDTTINNLYQKGKSENISLFQAIQGAIANDELKGKAKDALKSLLGQIEKWRASLENTSLAETAKLILMESGYIQMWQSENTLESQGRIENIDEFVNSLSEFSNITEFLEYVSLVEAKEEKQGQDAVNVMTVHAAKGLEFSLVFIPGLEDGVFPSSRSVEERNGVEEERRLLYVAITRARKELIMCYAQTRFVFGDYQSSLPSRFLKELPENVAITVVDNSSSFQSRSYGASSSQAYSAQGSSRFQASQAQGSSRDFSRLATSRTSNQSFSASQSHFATSAPQRTASSDPLFGKRVFHQKFGYGKVFEIDGSKLGIDFEKSGRKVVMKDFITYEA